MEIGANRLAQRQDSDRRRVAVVSVTQRFHRGLDDVLGGAKIRLPDAEIDDVAALRGERRGARQHGECVLLADPIERRDCLHGRFLLP